jgi:predicted histidine transporter YuiF (NhaC family)
MGLGALTASELGMLISVCVAVCGLALQVFLGVRKDRRDQRDELRRQQEHDARMARDAAAAAGGVR